MRKRLTEAFETMASAKPRRTCYVSNGVLKVAIGLNYDSLGQCHAHVKQLVSQVCDEAESVCVALSAHEVISTSLDNKQDIDMSY